MRINDANVFCVVRCGQETKLLYWQKVLRAKPPTHFCVLKFDLLNPSNLWNVFKRFARLIRDHVRNKYQFEYAAYIEQSQKEPPHIHLLATTHPDLSKDLIRNLWVKACAETVLHDDIPLPQVSVYWQPIRDAKSSARYVPKFWHYRDVTTGRLKQYKPWLPSEEWFDVNLHITSKKFLSHPRKELWEMVKRDWFPDGEIDWDEYETWEPQKLKINLENDEELESWLARGGNTDELLPIYSRFDDDDISNFVRSADVQMADYFPSEGAIKLEEQQLRIYLTNLWKTAIEETIGIPSECPSNRAIKPQQFWVGTKVKCCFLPDIPCVVARKEPYDNTYTIRFKLREQDRERIPESVLDRIYEPAGTRGHTRLDVCSHDLELLE